MESGNRNGRIQINILNSIQQFHTFIHRLLESFTPTDQSHATGTLIDNSRNHSIPQIGSTERLTAGIYLSDTTHIAISHLITAKVNRMFRSQLCVHTLICFTETDSLEATIIRRKFLFYDIRLDSYPKSVCLPGKVGSCMIIHTVILEIVNT